MGRESHASLPWDQLSRRDDIPWSALHTFANAVVADRELTTRLFELYDRAYDNLPGGGAADILVPGVFALNAVAGLKRARPPIEPVPIRTDRSRRRPRGGPLPVRRRDRD